MSRPQSAQALAYWLAVPVFAIVALLIGAAVWAMMHAAARLDGLQNRSETTLARTAFATASDPIVRSIQDYSFWDETYDQTGGEIDLEWAEQNLGPYLSKTYSATHVFVFAGDGKMLYASIPGKDGSVQFVSEREDQLAGLITPELRSIGVAALDKARADDISGIQGFVRYQDQPVFIAARPIRPDNPERQAKDKPINALVMILTLDEEALTKLSTAFGLPNLRLSHEGMVGLDAPIAGMRGMKVSWYRRTPSREFFTESLEVLVPVALLAFILIALAGRGWMRAVRTVRDAEFDALAERAKSVQDTARAKSLFIANMSHELRTPLNAIIGFSEIIKDQMFGPANAQKYASYAGDIHASGKHLLRIVNNILTLSKIEAQQQRITIEDVELPEIAANAILMARQDADKRQVSIETSIADGLRARADAQALTQIVINLVSNAVKFSERGGTVRLQVAAGQSGESVRVVVADNGCGIPAETLSQLGQPFTQAEDPYRRNYQGTGLGLSICFALARGMGATLEIESAVNKGTTATLTLPAAAMKPDQATQSALTPAPHAA
jgi:signal transduction histidine kinase